MIGNHIKIALRSIFKHRLSSLINIAGLAVGLTCCLLIGLYVQHELSYDRFHDKADRIVRVTMNYNVQGNENEVIVTGTKVLPAFKRNFPEVENGVRFFPIGAIVRKDDQILDEDGFVYADSTFFEVFSFELLQGNPKTALENPNAVVLTESTAKRYFGDESPIGKVLQINNSKDFEITGIVQDPPANSQIKFDFLAPFSAIGGYSVVERWWGADYITYLLLKSPESIASLQAKIPAYMDTQKQENGLTGSDYMHFNLEPLTSVYLHSDVGGSFEANSDIRYIYIFTAIALLILGIACANYMNMTTARAAERAREVGIRKVVGAQRKQLFWQFVGESILLTAGAMLLSLAAAKLLMPFFNQLAGREIPFQLFENPRMLIAFIALGVFVSLLAGSYPALVLSGFQPIKTLKGEFKIGTANLSFRKVLIVFQFAISISLIVCTIVIQRQLHFIQNKNLGYEKAQRLVLPSDQFINEKIQTFKDALKSHPNVLNVATSRQTPTNIPSKFSIQLEDRNTLITANGVDENYVKTMGLELISGTDFTKTDYEESSSGARYAMIMNESAVRDFGWTPDEAIGKKATFEGRPSEVRGVVKDFHFASLHEPIQPITLFIEPFGRRIILEITSENLLQTLSDLETTWKAFAPHRPFDYYFLDEEFNDLYKAETRTGSILSVFSALAILLACLGLFGLAVFMAAQRTKEIGIRKVLGASVSSIVALLSKDFLQLVLISTLIAFPLAWFAMSRWLEDFAYRTQLSWWIFALAVVVVVAIALITVSFQAIRAAVANPVDSLRSE
ncbi:MAG: ABC transporter permease [Saprospiraceae bacterium]|nr:ABC transporter permease [Saprospiraceae bacterium]